MSFTIIGKSDVSPSRNLILTTVTVECTKTSGTMYMETHILWHAVYSYSACGTCMFTALALV